MARNDELKNLKTELTLNIISQMIKDDLPEDLLISSTLKTLYEAGIHNKKTLDSNGKAREGYLTACYKISTNVATAKYTFVKKLNDFYASSDADWPSSFTLHLYDHFDSIMGAYERAITKNPDSQKPLANAYFFSTLNNRMKDLARKYEDKTQPETTTDTAPLKTGKSYRQPASLSAPLNNSETTLSLEDTLADNGPSIEDAVLAPMNILWWCEKLSGEEVLLLFGRYALSYKFGEIGSSLETIDANKLLKKYIMDYCKMRDLNFLDFEHILKLETNFGKTPSTITCNITKYRKSLMSKMEKLVQTEYPHLLAC